MANRATQIFVDEHASRPGRDTLTTALSRAFFIGVSLTFLAALLFAPLATVFVMAFEKGWQAYLHSFSDADTGAAIRLTLFTAAVVVPLNTLFGLSAAWAIAKLSMKRRPRCSWYAIWMPWNVIGTLSFSASAHSTS